MVASPQVNLNGFRIASGHDCEDELRMRPPLVWAAPPQGQEHQTEKQEKPVSLQQSFLKLFLLHILFTATISITNTLHSAVN